MIFNNGLFQYEDKLSDAQIEKLPSSLLLNAPSSEAVLLRLLLGGITISKTNEIKRYNQPSNYTLLPFKEKSRFSYESFDKVFSTDITKEEAALLCNKYFQKNRKNTYVHNQMLFEFSSYLLKEKLSPTAAFVHLYRCLEFMSYSFPMIYSSISKDYRGTYESLKKFMGGDSSGELAFMKKFVKELFEHDQVLNYQFDIDINMEGLDKAKTECKAAFRDEFSYNFEGQTFSITFENMMALFICLRNRYFHFLIGGKRINFTSIEYDIEDLFQALNPYFANWIAVIFCKIIQDGFDSLAE